jgi:mono/diheme cytochrome c family protein
MSNTRAAKILTILLFSIVTPLAFMAFFVIGGPGSSTLPTLSAEDQTATLCSVGTIPGKEYVMLFEVFGTPTPDPLISVAVLPTDTPTPGLVATPVGDVTRGQELFNGLAACIACHRVDNDEVNIGPSLKSVAQRASTRLPNTSAETYLRQSILNPNDYLVDGMVAGVMPTTYNQTLTLGQLQDIITYLLTLR